MELTRKNFKESLGIIDEAIKEASFLAIDSEFSGLDTSNSGHAGPFDTPEERYHKIRVGCSDFLLMQFGLCAFKYDEENRRYEVKSFNFYIFPKPHSSRAAYDVKFMCQSSSMDFLASNGFDFNKVFREGIPYLTPTQEQSEKEYLKVKHEQAARFSSPAFLSPDAGDPAITKGPASVPDEHKDFIDNICSTITKFLDESTDESINLPPCTGFQRKLIYQTVRIKFSSVHLEASTNDKKQRFITVTRVKNDGELKKLEAVKQATEFEHIDDAVGFSKVMRMVSQSGILVVGHNMLLDLVHCLHQFHFPLPQEYSEFKAMIRCVFPRLIDTKLMANTHPFKEIIYTTGLGELVKILEHPPFMKPEVVTSEGFPEYSTTAEKLHEAGYDAYITGLSFISMANYLGTFQSPPMANVLPTSSFLQPFTNKLFLMRVNDIPYMNLTGPELQPARNHIFHVSFPKEWKIVDINQLFSPFGCVQISWLSDTSAFVALYKKDNADVVLKTLTQGETYQVLSYEVYKRRTKRNHHLDHGTKKRPVIDSDVEHPGSAKKLKPLNAEATTFVTRSITPIPEEDEEENDEDASKTHKSYAEIASANYKKEEKMFVEPETW